MDERSQADLSVLKAIVGDCMGGVPGYTAQTFDLTERIMMSLHALRGEVATELARTEGAHPPRLLLLGGRP